ncbi:MAG: hypothetical protein P1U74_08990 [Legionellaceae bacterium]|nr:hypothetical protein [Legionellaceae bacterium]
MYDSGMVKIKSFKHVGQDELGVTKEFSLSRLQQEFVYISRKKGSLAGNSYHLGLTAATDPKTFLLLAGEMELSYRHLDSKDEQNVRVMAPALVEIQPKTIHSVLSLTDTIILECNAIADIQQDIIQETVEV